MVSFTVRMRFDAVDREQVTELLRSLAQESRQEPGCQRFEVYHSTADATRFLLNEHWESQDSVDAHRKAMSEMHAARIGRKTDVGQRIAGAAQIIRVTAGEFVESFAAAGRKAEQVRGTIRGRH